MYALYATTERLHRVELCKMNYLIWGLGDVLSFSLTHLPNSIQNGSISGV